VKWALNAAGFRGPEIKAEAGQTRVVAYGASETFGIYEDPGKEYPRALERDLNLRLAPDEFEVINAGMPGMRVGSGITYLYDIGRELHPKVVVIYPTPTHYVGVTHPYCGRSIVPPPAAAFPTSRVAERLKDRLKDVLPPAGLTMLREVAIAWTARQGRVLDRVQPQSLEALATDLHCAVQAAREIGAIPILVTHANRFGLRPRPDDYYWLTGWRLQYPEIRQGALLDLEARANARIRAVAEQEHVRVVDAAALLSGDPANFADHAHFTNTGAEKMGALLSRAIAETLVAGEPGAHPGPRSSAPISAALP
jgi:lysophospholipase L1-like esterase